MKRNLCGELVFRSIYLTLAVTAFVMAIGYGNGGFNTYFFTDYFNWTLVMSVVCTVGAIAEGVRIGKSGHLESYTKKFPFLKFCTFSGMIFAFLMGAFFVIRVGDAYLQTAGYGDFAPGILTAGYYTNPAVLLARCVCPAMYIVMYILFDEKGTTRKIYAKLGIVPPTAFYLFDKFFGMAMAKSYGGAEGLMQAGKYGIAYPFFFYDEHTYYQKWWALAWPCIFGAGLVILNKISFIISRMCRDENGKLYYNKNAEINESEMTDIFHKFKKKK